jgi:hypothetical protein
MLKIFHNELDLSREQSRYEYMSNTLDLNDYDLYVGYYKPISTLFLNVIKNTEDLVLDVKYYSGSIFESVYGFKDLSFGLTTPGFISWKNRQVGQVPNLLFGETLYWYKLTTNDPANIVFRGISTLFSDDYDLIAAYPSIMNHLPEGQQSFVRFHEEAAKDIIIDLRRTGLVINGKLSAPSVRKQLDAFDLLDKEEVRDAAKYFALSKIFAWLSDAPNDKWENLAAKYEAEAAGSLTPLITIDQNDNGIIEDYEEAADQPIIVGRL